MINIFIKKKPQLVYPKRMSKEGLYYTILLEYKWYCESHFIKWYCESHFINLPQSESLSYEQKTHSNNFIIKISIYENLQISKKVQR